MRVQILADSLDRAVRREDSYYNTLIRILATRCMTQAGLFQSGFWALGFQGLGTFEAVPGDFGAPSDLLMWGAKWHAKAGKAAGLSLCTGFNLNNTSWVGCSQASHASCSM